MGKFGNFLHQLAVCTEVRGFKGFGFALYDFFSALSVVRDEVDFALQARQDHSAFCTDQFKGFFVFGFGTVNGVEDGGDDSVVVLEVDGCVVEDVCAGFIYAIVFSAHGIGFIGEGLVNCTAGLILCSRFDQLRSIRTSVVVADGTKFGGVFAHFKEVAPPKGVDLKTMAVRKPVEYVCVVRCLVVERTAAQ